MTATSPIAALELVYRGEDEVVALACPRCGSIFTPLTFGSGEQGREVAEKLALDCCDRHCRCGVPLSNHRVICKRCWALDQRARDLKKFQLSKKIQENEYDGPVYWEGVDGGSMGGGCFANLDEVREYCTDEDVETPGYVWACTEVKLTINVDNILESAFQEHHEGARDFLAVGAEKELELLLTAWCGRQGIKSWQADFRRAILLKSSDSV